MAKKWRREYDPFTNLFYQHNMHTGADRVYTHNCKFLHDTGDPSSPVIRIDARVPSISDMFGVNETLRPLEHFKRILRDTLIDMRFDPGQIDEVLTARHVSFFEPLYAKWNETRDANWLYSMPEYVFETIHCLLHHTAKLGNARNGTPDQFSEAHNMIAALELLYSEYDRFSVLELGPGIGYLSLLVAHRFPNASVYVEELNPQSLQLLTTLRDLSDAGNLYVNCPFPTSFDVLMAFEVLEHIPSLHYSSVGEPMPWLDPYLCLLKHNAYFLYDSMWGAEWQLNHRVMGHFLRYKFDDVIHEKDPFSARTPFYKACEEALLLRGMHRVRSFDVQPCDVTGVTNITPTLRGGVKVYVKK